MFAGDGLLPAIAPALDHLATARARPGDLIVRAWDTESTGVLPPRFPWGPADVRERGELPGWSDEGIRTIFHGDLLAPEADFRALTVFDGARSAAWFWVLAPERVPWWERAAPLRPALHLGLRRPGRLLVHAAAVGTARGGVLLGGPGGAGKSTTAVAALLAGMEYAGDDYVLLDVGGAGRPPTAHALYGTAKLAPESLALLGLPPIAGAGEDGEKVVLDAAALAPAGMCPSLPIRAVVVPRLAARTAPRLVPISPIEALRALAPSTIYQLPADRGSALRPLAEVVRRLPCFGLELEGGPSAATALLAELCDREGAA